MKFHNRNWKNILFNVLGNHFLYRNASSNCENKGPDVEILSLQNYILCRYNISYNKKQQYRTQSNHVC